MSPYSHICFTLVKFPDTSLYNKCSLSVSHLCDLYNILDQDQVLKILSASFDKPLLFETLVNTACCLSIH